MSRKGAARGSGGLGFETGVTTYGGGVDSRLRPSVCWSSPSASLFVCRLPLPSPVGDIVRGGDYDGLGM